jgi:hypothetical protein
MKERMIIERIARGYRVTLVRDPMVQVEGEPPLTPAQLQGVTKYYDVAFLGEVTDLVEKKFTRAGDQPVERLIQSA